MQDPNKTPEFLRTISKMEDQVADFENFCFYCGKKIPLTDQLCGRDGTCMYGSTTAYTTTEDCDAKKIDDRIREISPIVKKVVKIIDSVVPDTEPTNRYYARVLDLKYQHLLNCLESDTIENKKFCVFNPANMYCANKTVGCFHALKEISTPAARSIAHPCPMTYAQYVNNSYTMDRIIQFK